MNFTNGKKKNSHPLSSLRVGVNQESVCSRPHTEVRRTVEERIWTTFPFCKGCTLFYNKWYSNYLKTTWFRILGGKPSWRENIEQNNILWLLSLHIAKYLVLVVNVTTHAYLRLLVLGLRCPTKLSEGSTLLHELVFDLDLVGYRS